MLADDRVSWEIRSPFAEEDDEITAQLNGRREALSRPRRDGAAVLVIGALCVAFGLLVGLVIADWAYAAAVGLLGMIMVACGCVMQRRAGEQRRELLAELDEEQEARKREVLDLTLQADRVLRVSRVRMHAGMWWLFDIGGGHFLVLTSGQLRSPPPERWRRSIQMVLDGRRIVLRIRQEGEAIERVDEWSLDDIFDEGRFRVVEDAGPLPVIAACDPS